MVAIPIANRLNLRRVVGVSGISADFEKRDILDLLLDSYEYDAVLNRRPESSFKRMLLETVDTLVTEM